MPTISSENKKKTAQAVVMAGGIVIATLGGMSSNNNAQLNEKASANNTPKTKQSEIIKTKQKAGIKRPSAKRTVAKVADANSAKTSINDLKSEQQSQKIDKTTVDYHKQDLNAMLKEIDAQLVKVQSGINQENNTENTRVQNIFTTINKSGSESLNLETQIKEKIDNGLTDNDLIDAQAALDKSQLNYQEESSNGNSSTIRPALTNSDKDNIMSNLKSVQSSINNLKSLNNTKQELISQKNEILQSLNRSAEKTSAKSSTQQLNDLRAITNIVMNKIKETPSKATDDSGKKGDNILNSITNGNSVEKDPVLNNGNTTNTSSAAPSDNNSSADNNQNQSSSAAPSDNNSSAAPSDNNQSQGSSAAPSDNNSSASPSDNNSSNSSSAAPSDNNSSAAPSDNNSSAAPSDNNSSNNSSAAPSETPSDNNQGQSSSAGTGESSSTAPSESNNGNENNNNENQNQVAEGGTLNFVKANNYWTNIHSIQDLQNGVAWNGHYLINAIEALRDNQLNDDYNSPYLIADDGFQGGVNKTPEWSLGDTIKNGQLSPAQQNELNEYAMMILNQYRSEIGLNQLQTSSAVLNATIARGNTLKTGQTQHDTNAIHNAFASQGLSDAAECLAPLDISATQGARSGDPTMLEMMNVMANAINNYLNADNGSNNGHRNILLSNGSSTGFVSRVGAFSVEYNTTLGTWVTNFNSID